MFAREPYASRSGQRVKNEGDRIFQDGGKQLILPVEENKDGYAGTFALALNTVRRKDDRRHVIVRMGIDSPSDDRAAFRGWIRTA